MAEFETAAASFGVGGDEHDFISMDIDQDPSGLYIDCNPIDGDCSTEECQEYVDEVVSLLLTTDDDDDMIDAVGDTTTNNKTSTLGRFRQVSDTSSGAASTQTNTSRTSSTDVSLSAAAPTIATATAAKEEVVVVQEEVLDVDALELTLTGRPAIPLYLSCNPDHLSEYQSEIRKHISFFEATPAHVEGNSKTKGRNKAIVLGQVGIQCCHCSHIFPTHHRAKGSTYFPHTLVGIYQAAQILSSGHLLETCPLVPPERRTQWKALQQMGKLTNGSSSSSTRTAGKDYWARTAQALGVYEDEHGLRFETRLPTYDELKARFGE